MNVFLTGTFERAIDDKRRIAIPKTWREALKWSADSVGYLAPGTDGSLALYPEAAFSELATRLATKSPTAQDVRAFTRLFYGQAQRVEVETLEEAGAVAQIKDEEATARSHITAP
ncbi:MAG: hypothetical protein MK179_16865, partial [Pirellulaceae bacterium]|nr:hypothetical protein [Pirellulaceae bacterium]